MTLETCWLSTLAKTWTLMPLRHLVSEIQTGPFGSQIHNDDYIDGGVPLINPSHIVDGKIVADLKCTVHESMAAQLNAYRLRQGDLVLARRGEMGRAAVVTEAEDGWLCGTGSMYLRPVKHLLDAGFLRYVLSTRGAREWLEQQSVGSTMNNLNAAIIGRMLIPYVPVESQISIRAHLDALGGTSDALLYKYEKMIELMEEKRVTLVTHAVNKGLDREAPTRDSGVQWLGRIPSHWEASRLAPYILDKTDGPFGSGLKNEHYADAGVRVIRLQNIGAGTFRDEDATYISEDYFSSLNGHDARPGDLLVAGLGDEKNFLGRACVLPSTVPIAMVKADCFRYRFREESVLGTFVAAFLNSSPGRFASSMQSRGATRQRMNLGALGTIVMPLPPLDEQRAIVNFLERAERLFEIHRIAVKDAIRLTKEHRAALINAAVTGQIDVQTYRAKDLEEAVA